MKIAYLINQYPKVSHTFIRREVLALEKIGPDITRFALRGWRETAIDETDKSEQQKTTYVLNQGIVQLGGALLASLVSNPIRFYNASSKKVDMIDTIQTINPETYETKLRVVVRNDFSDGDLVYQQPKLTSATAFNAPEKIGVGKGFMRGESVVNEPFDFTTKNYYALEDQQAVLRAALFPESIAPEKRFNLTDDDYRFVWKYMSQLPTESTYPPYAKDTSMYDSYCKFLMFGDNKKPMPKNIRIFNKVGDAYGFLLDNAYIVDFDKGVEFMLSAIIYCNSDGIFNDDKYDYETVGDL